MYVNKGQRPYDSFDYHPLYLSLSNVYNSTTCCSSFRIWDMREWGTELWDQLEKVDARFVALSGKNDQLVRFLREKEYRFISSYSFDFFFREDSNKWDLPQQKLLGLGRLFLDKLHLN